MMVFTVEQKTDGDDLSNEVCLWNEPEKIKQINNLKKKE